MCPFTSIAALMLCLIAGSPKTAKNRRIIRSRIRRSGSSSARVGLLPVGWIAGCAGSSLVPSWGLSASFCRSSAANVRYVGSWLRSESIALWLMAGGSFWLLVRG